MPKLSGKDTGKIKNVTAEVIKKMERGDNIAMDECKAEEFKEWLIENERSANTIDSYIRSVRQFFVLFLEVSKKNMIEFKQIKLSVKT